MQSTANPISNSQRFQLPWKSTNSPQLFPKTLKFTPSRKTLTSPLSLRTSINYEPEEGLDQGPKSSRPTKLPVVVRESGRVSRYFWDGNCLQLVNVDGGALSLSFDFDDGFRKLFRICSLTVKDFFIPKQVTENYLLYVKWKLLHRVFSSALQVLATQVTVLIYKEEILRMLLVEISQLVYIVVIYSGNVSSNRNWVLAFIASSSCT